MMWFNEFGHLIRVISLPQHKTGDIMQRHFSSEYKLEASIAGT